MRIGDSTATGRRMVASAVAVRAVPTKRVALSSRTVEWWCATAAKDSAVATAKFKVKLRTRIRMAGRSGDNVSIVSTLVASKQLYVKVIQRSYLFFTCNFV